jgi:hypothetical protein
MKMALSILLFLVTCTYILPVKEIIKNNTVISMTDMDETKDENNNKEKQKEFFFISGAGLLMNKTAPNPLIRFIPAVPVLLHTIETPPPDLI